MTNNFIKVALVGVAAYFAYDYYKKNKKGVNVVAGGSKSDVSEAELAAEMEEEGEEGMAVTYANASGNCGRGQTWCSMTRSCVSQAGYPQNCRDLANNAGISRRRRTSGRRVAGANIAMANADGWDSDSVSFGM